MHSGIRQLICAITIFLLCGTAYAVPLRKSLARLSAQDTTCKVWVIFTDKNNAPQNSPVSLRAQKRRMHNGILGNQQTDIHVSQEYCKAIEQRGGHINFRFKWANAVSVSVNASKLPDLASLLFVKDILNVRSGSSIVPKITAQKLYKKTAFDTSVFYGQSWQQLSTLAVPAAQQYLKSTYSAVPGDSMVIGLFDSGFRTKHKCFTYFHTNNRLLAQYDFIDNDTSVVDPDSVASNPANPYYMNDEHGSMTLSLIAGYDSTHFIGTAWNAHFILARTEDSKQTADGEIEKHYEEDNWAAAMVWAESLGVDIVSSSLGYRDGFTPPDTDYTFADMNGKTTIISKAATIATQLGVLVVNAMGNDGDASGSISAPADVENVVSVGAIDPSLTIALFSSRGPTSDGRIKPDCVAPGKDVVVPVIYNSNDSSYTTDDGTSFSTPLTAGVCALTWQANRQDSSAQIRQRLYASCVFAPAQTSRNNTYGRGIPNALIACSTSTITSRTGSNILIYPTIIDIHKKHQQLICELLTDNPRSYSQLFTLAIRALDGSLVYSNKQYCAAGKPVTVKWPQAGTNVSPGIYFVIINYAGNTSKQKIMVVN